MRSAVLLILYVLIVILMTPVILVCMLAGVREPLLRIGKWVMSLSRVVLGIRLEIEGLDRFGRKDAYVFMANHVSFLDGPLLFYVVPRLLRVIIKKSVFRLPVLGQGMRFVGFVPVDRKGIRGGKASIDLASRLMRERGYPFLIFPEGTRSRDGRIQPFRRGGFFLAMAAGAPIVPVSINGTFELMPKGSFIARRGTILVVFHPPIPVEGYNRGNLEGLMAAVKAAIKSGLDAHDYAASGPVPAPAE
jgi:1-acyl-sn-glycerol-3-phosphate acyltransferase